MRPVVVSIVHPGQPASPLSVPVLVVVCKPVAVPHPAVVVAQPVVVHPQPCVPRSLVLGPLLLRQLVHPPLPLRPRRLSPPTPSPPLLLLPVLHRSTCSSLLVLPPLQPPLVRPPLPRLLVHTLRKNLLTLDFLHPHQPLPVRRIPKPLCVVLGHIRRRPLQHTRRRRPALSLKLAPNVLHKCIHVNIFLPAKLVVRIFLSVVRHRPKQVSVVKQLFLLLTTSHRRILSSLLVSQEPVLQRHRLFPFL